MKETYNIPTLPLSYDLETKAVMRQLNSANKRLAELKGIAHTIPNENILINTLVLQEACDSSAVENIVTTRDDLYRAELDLKGEIVNVATKEVMNYREAMQVGFNVVKRHKLLTLNDIKTIQQKLPNKTAGAIRNKLYRIYGTGDLDKIKGKKEKTQEFKSSNKKWTEEEKQILEDMIWEGLSIKEIQKYLPNRSIEAIRRKMKRLVE